MCFADSLVAIVVLFPRQNYVAELRNCDDSGGDATGPDPYYQRFSIADG